jgi:hypothetical protein
MPASLCACSFSDSAAAALGSTSATPIAAINMCKRSFPGVLAIQGFDDVEPRVLEREGHHLAHRAPIVHGKD